MSTDEVLSIEQKAELVPILTAYLDHANVTLAELRAILHQGRHAQVARRALRLLDDRQYATPVVGTQEDTP